MYVLVCYLVTAHSIIAAIFHVFENLEMETTKTLLSPEKVARLDIDYSVCIICQTETDDTLVENPSAYEKILLCVRERAAYGDQDYSEISRRLGDVTCQELQTRSASWHRKCQQNTVHAGMRGRAKRHYEKRLLVSSKKLKEAPPPHDLTTFTRSRSTPYKSDLCFFCDLGAARSNPLHLLATGNASISLKEAIEKSGDEQLRVKLSTSIDSSDAHAIDVKYHRRCWATHVTNVWRVKQSSKDERAGITAEIASEIEFCSMVEGVMLDGKILNMSELQDSFSGIRSANNVTNPECTRKTIKHLLQNEIPNIEFNKPKRVNESERCTIKANRDKAINLMEETDAGMDSDMRVLYKASTILRRAIGKAKKWTFTGTLSDSTSEHVPEELYIFYRWIIQGPSTTLSTDKKDVLINKHAISLAQSTVAKYLSVQQVGNKKTKTFKMTHEMPQQLAIGIALRQATRSKKIVNILHKFGVSVEYNRLLRIEGQISYTVLQRMALNDDLYIPPDVVMGRYVFFAVDNVDFAEDTSDGKRTLHATAMAIYQRSEPSDETPKLELTGSAQKRSIKDLPSTVTSLMKCLKPPAKPQSPSYASFCLDECNKRSEYLPDVAWLVGRTLCMVNQKKDVIAYPRNDDDVSKHIPSWSAYHSLVTANMPLTRVGSPPLIASPAHEWNTLLTVLMQAQGISAKVVGSNHKTVVSLDMGLYKPAKQLQMARSDMGHLILRPGELHVVMAQLCCIGSYIENSGLDFCWTEADLYGPLTVRQILEGKHVRRALDAHMITLQVLFMLQQEAFFKDHRDLVRDLSALTNDLALSFTSHDPQEIRKAHLALVQIIELEQVMEKMDLYEAQNKAGPGAIIMRQYMQMVMEMILFIRAVRTGNWELHITALESFTKYFFAHDKLVYARMIPLYLADMKSVKESDKEIYQEFENGNWVVNKNRHVPFCAIGADHALEHVNRAMKVAGGLVGITLNSIARTKFFIIAPELARLAAEACEVAGVRPNDNVHHHALSNAALSRQEKSIDSLMETLQSFTNPFEGDNADAINLVTKEIVPETVKNDLISQPKIGQDLFDAFVENRIKTTTINLWDPMKKRQMKTWKTTGKRLRVTTEDKIVELQEDRSLFARMLLVSKSRPDINIADIISNY